MIPFVVNAASPNMVRTEVLSILEIRWVGASAAGDEVIIKDSLDHVLWHSVACGEFNLECSDLRREWKNGFKVPTLDSGVLYVLAVVGKDAS